MLLSLFPCVDPGLYRPGSLTKKSDLSDLAGETSLSGRGKPGKTGVSRVAVTDMSRGVSESLPPSSWSSVSCWELSVSTLQCWDFLVRSTAASRLTDWSWVGRGTMGRYLTPGSIIALKTTTVSKAERLRILKLFATTRVVLAGRSADGRFSQDKGMNFSLGNIVTLWVRPSGRYQQVIRSPGCCPSSA